MVPRTSRGHSFAGASQYYFHDKGAQSSERVEWVETHNVPSEDPDKAIKWMQYTAMNANKIKQEVGGSMVGRKSTKGEVYTYSLSWHVSERPDEEHMKSCMLETLEVLGLKDHEAIFVAHNDTEHPHAHAIVNLISPLDGKMNTVYNDQKRLSRWAEAYEKEHGIHCEKRIENNKNRAREQGDKKRSQYKQEQLKRAQLVHDLYTRSDGGKAFQAAMRENGFELTTGKRRALSFVDERGKIHSLSRHMNLVVDKEEYPKWRSDIIGRLKSVELKDAGELAIQKKKQWEESQYFDRDKYHSEWQDKVDKAGIDSGELNSSNRDKKEILKSPDNKSVNTSRNREDLSFLRADFERNKFLAILDFQQSLEKGLDKKRSYYEDYYDIEEDRKSVEALIKERDDLSKWFNGSQTQKLNDEIARLQVDIDKSRALVESQMKRFEVELQEKLVEFRSGVEKKTFEEAIIERKKIDQEVKSRQIRDQGDLDRDITPD